MLIIIVLSKMDLPILLQDEDSEQIRKEHQAELARQKQAEGLARFGDGVDHQTSQRKAIFRKFESYKRDTSLPK